MTGGTMTIWDLFKKPSAPDPGEAAPADPSLDLQVRGCTQAVLEEWAGFSPVFLGLPGSRPLTGMVSLGAPLDGPRRGLLCISATHRLGALLAVKATGDPGAGSFSGEALRELCQQLRESLLFGALGLDQRDYLIHAPEALSHERWPLEKPVISLLATVEGYPLEIRLWLF